MSKRTTVTLEEHHLEILNTEKERMEDEEPSNSEAVRRLLERADEADSLRDQVDDLEARIEDLRNQLAAANERIDASNELARAVEQERALETRRAQAGALTRLKWWALGMPEDD